MKNWNGTKPKHIIWDWNGTLLDDVQPCIDAINRMLKVRQLSCIDREQYRNIFDFPVKDYYRRLGFDLASEDWDAMAKEFHRHYHELTTPIGLRFGIKETLGAIRDCGIPMSILSACEITILERMLKERDIRHYFDHVFGLDNLYANSKLDQGQSLIRILGLPTDEMLLIGDTNHDHEIAEQLGLHCILLDGGHQAEHRLPATNRIQTPQALVAHLGIHPKP